MQQILFLLMTLISKEFLGLRRKFLVVERNDSLDNSIGLPVWTQKKLINKSFFSYGGMLAKNYHQKNNHLILLIVYVHSS